MPYAKKTKITKSKPFPRYGSYHYKRPLPQAPTEVKFLDQTKSATLVVATNTGAELDPATTNCLNAVPQGDDQSSRDGRKYQIRAIHVNGVFYRQNRNGQAEVGDANYVTVALVQDTQTNGAQCQSEEVFTSPGVAALPFLNLTNSKRFRVLYRATIVVPPGPASYDGTDLETGGSAVPFSIHKQCNIIVNCTGTSGNITDISDNSLHLMAFRS